MSDEEKALYLLQATHFRNMYLDAYVASLQCLDIERYNKKSYGNECNCNEFVQNVKTGYCGFAYGQMSEKTIFMCYDMFKRNMFDFDIHTR